ncbi:MAG: hypothetical protein A3G23_01155 [Bacteroidetes bacterium RIFCSPLOWO2_12_FULL_37_12]|nr:MAG: hypothetical protein A3G23_01155 [Bacteroidetes bacterium RIFCSPLOWO2_12_FULL_37_12]
MKSIFKFLIVAFFIIFTFKPITVFSQENSNDANQNKKLGFDLHAGLGFANGVRFGTCFYFNNSLSIEGNFGIDLFSYMGGDLRSAYGVGINFQKNSLLLSLLGNRKVRLEHNSEGMNPIKSYFVPVGVHLNIIFHLTLVT